MKPLPSLAIASALFLAACNSTPNSPSTPPPAASPSALAPAPVASPATTPQAGHGADSKSTSRSITWKHLGSHDYEKQYPGMGYSRRFQCDEGWIDLYEYTGGYAFWSDKLDDPVFKNLYSSVINEVLVSSKRQGESKIIREEKIQVGGVSLLHTEFELTMRERRTESHLYLAPLGGRIIKFRISLSVPGDEALRRSWLNLMGEQLERILGELREESQKMQSKQLQLSIMINPPGPEPERDALWLGYAAARLDYLVKQKLQLRRPTETVLSSFDEELYARQTALTIYKELQEKNATLRDPYWDALKQIQDAGYLRQYVWLCHRAPFWGLNEAPPELEAALAMLRNIPNFSPETKAGIIITEATTDRTAPNQKP